jgi:hypothetical protein
MELIYYSIKVHLRNKAEPISAIRSYPTNDYNEVYKIVSKGISKYYSFTDILKIDVWPLPENSNQVQEYIKKKHNIE